jgi:hypothetical protein
LDMVFVPHLPVPLTLDSLLPLHLLLYLLSLLVTSPVVEKLILLAVLAGAGLGLHRLLPAKSEWARYAAGFLYMINPFTYGRLMAGQYLVLAGYALMPWFVTALVRFVRRPQPATAWRLAAWGAAIALTSLHYLGFAALAALIAVALQALALRRARAVRLLAVWAAAVAAGILVINAYWLLPLLLHRTPTAALIGSFDERYFLSFHTIADPTFGQMLNTLGLYGFWGDAQGQYLLPKAIFGYWWLLALIILALSVIGAYKYWKQYRFFITLMVILLISGFVLAQGIMGSPFAPLNHWLMTNAPFYRGYREPGKFIGLIALGVCGLFGLGTDWLLNRAARTRLNPQWLPGLLVALPIAYTPLMLFGAAGQLRAVDYPADWYALNRTLKAEHSTGKVLFLPWHQYLTFPFTGRLIANPAPRFFARPTVAGDNAEIGLIYTQTPNPQSTFIEQQILTTGRTDVAAKLRSRSFEYVVLAKAADYKDYAWLDSQPGLTRVSDTSTLRVYKIK